MHNVSVLCRSWINQPIDLTLGVKYIVPHPLSAEQIAAIDHLFARWDTPTSPGAALAIIKDGAIVYERGYGMSNLEHAIPITSDSIFHIASMSKQFTATCLLLLAADGVLSLDDDVRRYLPEIPNYGTTITLRQMLHHTSGLRDHWTLQRMAGWRDDDLITGDDVLEIVSRQKALNFAPGTEHLYCNSGYSLQATIVQRITGMTLRQIAQERIFGPLGMTNTHFHDDHTEIVPGRTQAYHQRNNGGYRISIPVFDTVGTTSLFTTVRDFQKWDHNFDEPTIGNAAFLEMLQTPGTLRYGTPIEYALGLVVRPYRGVTLVEHSGGDAGYRSHYLRVPEHRLSVVVLANLPEVTPWARARQIVDLCLPDAVAPLELPSGKQPTAGELNARVGIYRNPNTGDLRRLSIADGRLADGFDQPLPLTPRSPRLFQADENDPSRLLQFDETDQAFTSVDAFGGGIDIPRYVRVETFDPSPTELEEYAADYWSDELGVSWRIAVVNGQITKHQRKFEPQSFVAADRDTFARDEFRLTFTRDTRGQIDGMFVGSFRVRNVRFERSRT